MSNPTATGTGTNQDMKGLVAAVAAAIQHEPESSQADDRKRKVNVDPSPRKKPAASRTSTTVVQPPPPSSSNESTKDVPKSRTRRLEQNRRAAIESRRRKKVMIAELQRSVTFYSKANSNLKMQNQDLERKIILARQQVHLGMKAPPEPTKESGSLVVAETNISSPVSPAITSPSPSYVDAPSASTTQADKAQHTATQALYESMGYPPGAARVAANTFSQFVGQTGGIPAAAIPPAVSSNVETAIAQLTPCPPDAESGNNPVAEDAPNAYIQALNQVCFLVRSCDLSSCNSNNNTLSTGLTLVAFASICCCRSQFALQQAAAANAAAAAANAALQAVNWHKRMQANGVKLPTGETPSFALPQHFSRLQPLLASATTFDRPVEEFTTHKDVSSSKNSPQ